MISLPVVSPGPGAGKCKTVEPLRTKRNPRALELLVIRKVMTSYQRIVLQTPNLNKMISETTLGVQVDLISEVRFNVSTFPILT
jgi:hypothetical protein